MHGGRASTSAIEDPIFAFTLRNEPGTRSSRRRPQWRGVDDRRASRAGETVDACASRFEQLARAEPLHAHARRSRAPARGADALDLREDLGVAAGPRARDAPAAIVDVPHDIEVERARDAPLDAPRARASLGRDARPLLAASRWTLAITDFKLRFYGSALGYVWTLVRPFAFFGVIYFVFTEIVDVGDDVKNYGVYILFALVLFQLLRRGRPAAASTASSTRENLLRKMRFPRLVIPLSVVARPRCFNLGMTLVAVFIFAARRRRLPDAGAGSS